METAVEENYDTNPAFAQGGNLDIPAFGGPMGIRWDEGAPFAYASPNAPDVRNVVGTAVLAILAGFTRYCHIERLRRVAFRKWLGGRPLDPLFDGDQMLLRLSG